jgi:hypothetical protein
MSDAFARLVIGFMWGALAPYPTSTLRWWADLGWFALGLIAAKVLREVMR